MPWLVPLPVALPLLVATLLLASERALPAPWPDAVATVTAVAVAAIAAVIAIDASSAPIVYWFGGWTPRHGVAIGIGFLADSAGAGCVVFVATLFVAAFVFSWGYFDEVHAHFHVLMLIFLAAMAGFCLTGDLFNLFVFFELMSVVAFALTGYKLESSALEGALNFTVTNSLASFVMLAGIGILYGRTGALNFAQLYRALAGMGGDPLVLLSLVLLVAALLVKAAIVPFHFWIADAHAVAPSPVCAIFSGIMVPLGLFGVARLWWSVFAGAGVPVAPFREVLIILGAITSLVGGLTALMQRHVKRLLALSTVSHLGLALEGIGVLSPQGLGGMLLYLAGHGLFKAALFIASGILLSECSGIDEIALRGHGKHLPVTGLVFAIGALALAGLPFGLAHDGHGLIDEAMAGQGFGWAVHLATLGTAFTGAALFRVTGRIFLGLGPEPGEEEEAPTESEREKKDRPVWLMLLPAIVLVGLALGLALTPIDEAVRAAAAAFADGAQQARLMLSSNTWHAPASAAGAAEHWKGPTISVGLALLLAAFQLCRDRLPRLLVAASDWILHPLLWGLDRVHSGRTGDYVAWIVVGLLVFGGFFAA